MRETQRARDIERESRKERQMHMRWERARERENNCRERQPRRDISIYLFSISIFLFAPLFLALVVCSLAPFSLLALT